jgi:hypothetical protein
MWFTIQPKSDTEIGWWIVHWNFEKEINEIKKNKKIGRCDRVMEHVVIFVCIYMQLQTVLFYIYDIIFVT